MWPISWQCLAIVTLSFFLSIAWGRPDFSDLPNIPYCASRYARERCCVGRMDDCSLPILGSRCYCDEFCDRNDNSDCCPDFWSHCTNITEPPQPIIRCGHHGKDYVYGQVFKINCKKCECTTLQSQAKVLCEEKRCLLEPDLTEEIMAQQSVLGWTARNYSEFWGRYLEEGVRLRLGTLNPSQFVYKMNSVHRIYDVNSMPEEFDSRSRWPRDISGIHDQGWCGASWAISTVDVASDRFAIMSKGAEDVDLSAQQLLSCNNRGQRGCNGGYLDRAWIYMRKFGLVDQDCYPWIGKDGQCKLRRRTTLRAAGCRNPPNPLRTELYKVGPAYRLGNETDIMQEILTSGPVQATMRVYQDFFIYQSGVYRHSPAVEHHESGYHSVRIIGWGVDRSYYGPPVKYWLVANSWGPQWGENGYFRILRGTNECEIESFVLGVWAKTV